MSESMSEQEKLVVIYRGLPGSGKSTDQKQEFPHAVVCSADHYFIGPDGVYRFDPLKQGAAHNQCMRHFLQFTMEYKHKLIVVDNTCTRNAEVAPYLAVAQALGYKVRIRRMYCDVDSCIHRNIHGVTPEIMRKMADQFEPLPPWYPKEELVLVPPYPHR